MKLPLEKKTIAYLTSQFAKTGEVVFVSVRPERAKPPISLVAVEAIANIGLKGDHYSSKGGKRQVTLIQSEYLDAVASMLGRETLDPTLLRRNIVVKGINLHSLKGKQFKIGDAVLEYTGECHPCSRMEENLGVGGYNAMRGHGGITAKVLVTGKVAVGDSLSPLDSPEESL